MGPRPSSQPAGRRADLRAAPAWAESDPLALGRSQPSIAWIMNPTAGRALRTDKTAMHNSLETLASLLSAPPRLSHRVAGGGGWSARDWCWPAMVRDGDARHAASAQLFPACFSLSLFL
jgi:hypothetical protein